MTAWVLVVRDPDESNAITTDGDVHVIDIDLGSGFDGTPDDTDEATEWASGQLRGLDDVPTNTAVFKAAIDTISSTVEDYPEAGKLVDEYVTRRRTVTTVQRPMCTATSQDLAAHMADYHSDGQTDWRAWAQRR